MRIVAREMSLEKEKDSLDIEPVQDTELAASGSKVDENGGECANEAEEKGETSAAEAAPDSATVANSAAELANVGPSESEKEVPQIAQTEENDGAETESEAAERRRREVRQFIILVNCTILFVRNESNYAYL